MTNPQSWTVDSLKDQVADAVGEPVTVEAGGETLRVVFTEQGDLAVTLTVSGDQILASTLLWPRVDQADPHAFEEHALRVHKLMPLSTFGITQVGGQDMYELFGALSARSSLDDIGLELRMLARNAVDMAEARGAATEG